MLGSCSACDRGMAARFFAFMGCDNLEHPLEKPKKQCRMNTPGRSGHGCPLWTQIRPCAHVPVCATLGSGEAGVLAYFSFKISSKFSLLSGRASGIIRHLTVGERQNSARRCDITLGGIFLCFQSVVWKLYFKRFFNFLFSSLGWWYFLFRPSSNTALSAVLTSLSVKADA